MLKIKDNVDLEELAKKYNMTFCVDYSIPFEDDNYGDIVSKNLGLSINWREDISVAVGTIIINEYCVSEENLNLLFDLIEAGLVEKINE